MICHAIVLFILLIMAQSKALDSDTFYYIARKIEYNGGDKRKKTQTKTLKTYSTKRRNKTENERTKTKVKAKDIKVIRYQGNSPKLGKSQGDCPYQCLVVFLWW